MNTFGKAVLLGLAVLAETTIAAAQSGAAQGESEDENRLICRRSVETGSLVKARRQCFTKAQWDRIADSQQTGARRTVEDLTGKPGGNN